MYASQALNFGTMLIAFIGYGCAITFALFSMAALLSAIVRGGRSRYVFDRKRGQAEFNRDMNAFVIAGMIAFVVAVVTVLALKLVG